MGVDHQKLARLIDGIEDVDEALSMIRLIRWKFDLVSFSYGPWDIAGHLEEDWPEQRRAEFCHRVLERLDDALNYDDPIVGVIGELVRDELECKEKNGRKG